MIFPYISRETLVEQTRPIFEEAFAFDPVRIEENVRHALGPKVSADAFVFVWSNLTTAELHALRRAIYPTMMEARGPR